MPPGLSTMVVPPTSVSLPGERLSDVRVGKEYTALRELHRRAQVRIDRTVAEIGGWRDRVLSSPSVRCRESHNSSAGYQERGSARHPRHSPARRRATARARHRADEPEGRRVKMPSSLSTR